MIKFQLLRFYQIHSLDKCSKFIHHVIKQTSSNTSTKHHHIYLRAINQHAKNKYKYSAETDFKVVNQSEYTQVNVTFKATIVDMKGSWGWELELEP